MKQMLALLIVLALSAVSGCASRDVDPSLALTYEPAHTPGPEPAAVAGDAILDDSAFDKASPISEETIADPLEPWNRMWFHVNDFMYMNILDPLYQGYTYVVPEALRNGLSNALRNLQAPIRIVNSLLQLEFAQAVVELGRFIVNTTVGGLGLAEIVTPEDALVPIHLDSANFGGTLAKWGVGEGAYLVWPFFGPSTVRDTLGLAGDAASGIPFWATDPIGPVNSAIGYGVSGGLRFNDIGSVLDNYRQLTKAAVEPYSSVRDAYIKLRRNTLLPVTPAP